MSSKILIFSPFKVGSSSLMDIFVANGYNLTWHHKPDYYQNYLKYDKFIAKGHHADGNNIIDMERIFSPEEIDLTFDIWFTIIRIPTEMYVSGYFQDITNKPYPYFFGSEEKCMMTKPRVLLNHFLKFPFNEYAQFSFDYNFSQIKKITSVDIWKSPFDKEKGYTIYKGNKRCKKVVVLTISILNNREKMNRLFKKLGLDVQFKALEKNQGIMKWYAQKYTKVKKLLPPAYYKRYAKYDQQIKKKFLHL